MHASNIITIVLLHLTVLAATNQTSLQLCNGLKEEACTSSSDGDCFFLVDIQACLPRCDSLNATRCQLEPMCQILSETGTCTSHCFTISPIPETESRITAHQWLAAVQRDSIACSLCTSSQSCSTLNQIANSLKNTATGFPLRTDDNPANMNCQWITLPTSNQITQPPSEWTNHVCLDSRLPSSNVIGFDLIDSARLVQDVQDAQKKYQSKDLNSLCYLEPIAHGSYQPNKKVLAPSETVQLHCDQDYLLANSLGGTVECSVQEKGQLGKGRSSVCIPAENLSHQKKKTAQRHIEK